jgi:ubiquitin-conjugating enzyme E2 Q
VRLVVYDTNLDDLEPVQKQRKRSNPAGDMTALHDERRLPLSWLSMKAFMSPIPSSNRSFIKQDDDKQHKVAGMSDYVQFRLVQGAADLEQV